MENSREIPIIGAAYNARPDKLMNFFIRKLNKVHCAKSHLIERFQEITTDPGFLALPFSVEGAIVLTQETISRINIIYVMLGAKPAYSECDELIDMLEEAFSVVQKNRDDMALCCLSMINYLEKIDKTQEIAYELMKLIATKLRNRELLESLAEVFEDKDNTLILLLTDTVLN